MDDSRPTTESPPARRERNVEGVSASEIAAVLGLSRYDDPFTIYHKKLSGFDHPPGISTAAIRRRMGLAQEPEILKLYSEATGRKVFQPGTLRHPERPWQSATPDALVVDEARGVECKTATWKESDEWGDPENPEETDKVPTEYWLQCQYGMSVTRSPIWDLPAWIAGEWFGIYTVRFDEEIEMMMLQAAEEFIEKHLKPRTPPPIGWTPESSRWIAERFPRHEPGLVLAANQEDETLATQLYAAWRLSDAIEAQMDLVKNRIKARMGNAEEIVGARGWKIRWKKNRDSDKIDWEAAAREMRTALQLIASVEPGTFAAEEIPATAREAAEAITRKGYTQPGARPFTFKKTMPAGIFKPRLPEDLLNLIGVGEPALLAGVVETKKEEA